jgi:sulfite exporter TauE/SafE
MMFVPALLMGLLGSAHCAVMCGGVASTMCGRPKQTLAFNAGRIGTYTLLGAVAGAFGALVPSFAIVLRPIAALVLLGVGLHLAGITNLFMKVEKIGLPIWKRLAPLTKRSLPSAALGAIWGFVPCGLVYAALTLAALTENAAIGALTMLAFGLGTMPAMTVVARIARHLARFRRTAGVLVLILGVHQTTLAFASADLTVVGAHCH